VVYHYWNELQQMRQACEQSEQSISLPDSGTGAQVDLPCETRMGEDLNIFLKALPIRQLYIKTIQSEIALHGQGRATYNFLWLLFRPGTIVLARDNSIDEGHLSDDVVERMVHHSSGMKVRAEGDDYPEIDPRSAKSSDTDGWAQWKLNYMDNKLMRQRYTFIRRYTGEKNDLRSARYPKTMFENS
jgi:hypothetical protein